MTDEELERRFDALMRRVNDNHEAVLMQLDRLESDVRNLRTEHTTTRDSVLALPMTVLRVIEGPLLGRLTGVEERVTKLERKGERG